MSESNGINPEDHIGAAIKLANRVMKRWPNKGVEFGDMLGAVYIILMRCSKSYDPTKLNPQTGKPYAFSTYFYKAVLHHSLAEVQSLAHGARRSKGGQRLQFERSVLELDFDYGGISLRETLSQEQELPDTDTDAARMCAQIEDIVSGLSDQFQDIYYYRIKRGETLEGVGKRLGLSKERVRQLQLYLILEIRGAVKSGGYTHLRDYAEGVA
ncbi:MAG: sigma-70 family RNA polymerase sigma factor [Phycisphaerales bacterium]